MCLCVLFETDRVTLYGVFIFGVLLLLCAVHVNAFVCCLWSIACCCLVRVSCVGCLCPCVCDHAFVSFVCDLLCDVVRFVLGVFCLCLCVRVCVVCLTCLWVLFVMH